MSVSVVKAGPYFSSGSISFSSLRTNFKETSGGQISASELRRNTNTSESNPIVPDSTENEQISTGSNLSISQFRNSIKRYFATQTGTDDNSSYSEPGFRMGRLDPNNRGIDWSGGGFNGRDGQGGGTTGNLTKNVQKFISINGTCGSVRDGQPGAQLSPLVIVHNVRMTVNGTIMGYGGRGGGNGGPDPSGESGTSGLNLGNVGNNNTITVNSGGKIYGGGGGGERGRTGNKGQDGECLYTASTSGCGGAPGCPSGYSQTSTTDGGDCNCRNICTGRDRRRTCNRYCSKILIRNCQQRTFPQGGAGGIGGRGGNGRGYNNQGGELSGQLGEQGAPPSIPGSTVSTSNFSYNWTTDGDDAFLNVSGGGGLGYCFISVRLYTNDDPNDAGTSYDNIRIRDGSNTNSPVLREWSFQSSRDDEYTIRQATAKSYRITINGNPRPVQIDGNRVKLRDFDGDDTNAYIEVRQLRQTSVSSGSCPGGTVIREAQRGEDGENGGSGGDWGQDGGSTNNSGNGGSRGKAISAENTRYSVDNRGDIKGDIY